MRSSAASSWSRQSHFSEPSTSEVQHSECTRQSTFEAAGQLAAHDRHVLFGGDVGRRVGVAVNKHAKRTVARGEFGFCVPSELHRVLDGAGHQQVTVGGRRAEIAVDEESGKLRVAVEKVNGTAEPHGRTTAICEKAQGNQACEA